MKKSTAKVATPAINAVLLFIAAMLAGVAATSIDELGLRLFGLAVMAVNCALCGWQTAEALIELNKRKVGQR